MKEKPKYKLETAFEPPTLKTEHNYHFTYTNIEYHYCSTTITAENEDEAWRLFNDEAYTGDCYDSDYETTNAELEEVD